MRDQSHIPRFQFIKASDDDEFNEALNAYARWVGSCFDYISAEFSLGQAEAFKELGVMLAVDVVIQHPNKSEFRWVDKSRYIHRIDTYRQKLAALMGRIDS